MRGRERRSADSRRARPRLVAGLLAALAPAACGGPDGGETPANEIRPATVAVGDTVGGLVVTAVDVHPLAGDSAVYTASVRFRGELELSGVYLPHFDHPDVDALCFHPDSVSALRVPRFAPDPRSSPDQKRWFCFTDRDAAAAAFAPPSQPRESRIRVRSYTATRRFTDAWDQAELVEVLEVGEPRENTLRGPRPQPCLRSLGPGADR